MDVLRSLSAVIAPIACAMGLAGPGTAHADVTVYRCTAAGGAVTLQDTPCTGGARQEVRTLQRPQDPPPRAAAPAAVEPAVADAPPPPQVVVVHAPQPMYECVTAGGERYTSDRGDGNPRFVPFGGGGLPRRGYPGGGGGGGVIGPSPAGGGLSTVPGAGLSTTPPRGLSTTPVGIARPAPPHPPVSPPTRPGPGPGHGHGHGHGYGYGHGRGYGYGGGRWVQDTCSPLPQREVCSRLGERRDTIRRRFFNAQESERRPLREEERTINARLAQDCAA